MAIYKGNKGEWGEVYVLLRLLADGVIYEGDEQMRRTENYIDILGVLRKEATRVLEFDRGQNDMVFIVGGGTGIPAQRFKVKADELLETIGHIRSNGKNSIPGLDGFLSEIGLQSVKSSPFTVGDGSGLNKKSDIVLKTRSRTGLVERNGYSIKSFLGSAPTLFNCAPASALVYEVVGASEKDVLKINRICHADGGCDMDGRIAFIHSHGLTLEPIGTAKTADGAEPFAANLELCGLDMLSVIQQMLLYRYGYKGARNYGHLDELIDMMVEGNPLGVSNPRAFYRARIAQFAYDSFAGLVATEPWDGRRRVNGGYIDVQPTGDILYFPARSDDQFTSYLVQNLKVEIPDKGIGTLKATIDSYRNDGIEPPIEYVERYERKAAQTNKTRGDYGYAYVSEEYADRKVCFKLNFTLRFM